MGGVPDALSRVVIHLPGHCHVVLRPAVVWRSSSFTDKRGLGNHGGDGRGALEPWASVSLLVPEVRSDFTGEGHSSPQDCLHVRHQLRVGGLPKVTLTSDQFATNLGIPVDSSTFDNLLE